MPDQLMLEAFGKLNPSVSERTTYFFDTWMESKKNIIVLEDKSKENKENFDKLCREMGLLPMWDYQIKGKEVRFLNKEDLAMIKLSWNNGR